MPAKNTPENFWKKVDQSDGPTACWPWMGYKDRKGYGQVRWLGKAHYAQRLAYMLAKGNIPAGSFVCHSCDNPACCNPAHLWVGSVIENNADMRRKNRDHYLYGENHPRAKLTNLQVETIRDMAQHGKGGTEIAKLMGLSRNTVYGIIYRHWRK